MMGIAAEARAVSECETEEIVSRFWPRALPASPGAAAGDGDDARRVAVAVSSGFVAVHAGNYPTAGNVAAAKAWNPAASDLLDRWADAWSRSFPNGLPVELADHLNESDEPSPSETRWLEVQAATARAYLDAGRFDKAGDPAWHAAAGLARRTPAGMRDWRAHVVDDAESVESLRHAEPGEAFLQVGDATFVLEGHRWDGSPILAPLARRDRDRIGWTLALVQSTSEVEYWNCPAFLAAAGRGFAVCKAERELHVTLLAMAMAGHRKAFLKGIAAKSGTWTVDLSDVRTPDCAMRETARAGIRWQSGPKKGIIVQEHVPFLFEQRFFVVGGRIVASVCSDRNHSAADARRDRILDERVARLDVPEIDVGEYDRGATGCVVGRDLSAALARAAQRIVRSLRGEVWEDYVLDMGLTDRGVLPVELNRLYCSGPYSLSRRRIVEARKRLASKARGLVADRVPEWMAKHRIDGDHRAVAAAASLMPLRSMAAAVDEHLGLREPQKRPIEASWDNRAFLLAAKNLCAVGTGAPAPDFGPRLDLEPSVAMAFAFMHGFRPLAAVPLAGFASRELRVSGRGDDGVETEPRYAAVSAQSRLCVGVRPSPDGGILAFALTTRAGMGADVRPLEIEPWGRANEREGECLTLCVDAFRAEVILRRARPGREGWSLCLERRGEADVSMDMPDLAIGADGYPLAHTWETGTIREPRARTAVRDFAHRSAAAWRSLKMNLFQVPMSTRWTRPGRKKWSSLAWKRPRNRSYTDPFVEGEDLAGPGGPMMTKQALEFLSELLHDDNPKAAKPDLSGFSAPSAEVPLRAAPVVVGACDLRQQRRASADARGNPHRSEEV